MSYLVFSFLGERNFAIVLKVDFPVLTLLRRFSTAGLVLARYNFSLS
jgi:hypothetical protein